MNIKKYIKYENQTREGIGRINRGLSRYSLPFVVAPERESLLESFLNE